MRRFSLAVFCLAVPVAVLGQTAPTVSVFEGDEALTVYWDDPGDATLASVYDVEFIRTSDLAGASSRGRLGLGVGVGFGFDRDADAGSRSKRWRSFWHRHLGPCAGSWQGQGESLRDPQEPHQRLGVPRPGDAPKWRSYRERTVLGNRNLHRRAWQWLLGYSDLHHLWCGWPDAQH